MHAEPYSIYVDKRPLRIAFIVHHNVGIQTLINIIRYNHRKWGGRYNPIVLSDGIKLTDEWLQFLKEYDADVIKFCFSPSEEIVQQIETFLSPLKVEGPEKDQNNIRLDLDGISIVPTPEILAQVAHTSVDHIKLVDLDYKISNSELCSFLEVNFGDLFRTSQVERELRNINVKSYKVDDFNDLAVFLKETSVYGTIVYPSQIASIPNLFSETKGSREKVFSVVIGDSPEDLVYYWNSIFLVPSHERYRLRQLWLPSQILNKKEVEKVLGEWIKVASDLYAGNTRLEFISFSFEETELVNCIADISSGLRHKIKIRPSIPDIKPKYPPLTVPPKLDLYKGRSEIEHIAMTGPNILRALDSGRNWMADIYIQYSPEKDNDENIIVSGKDYLWKLPQNNQLAWKMFNKPSRINKHRIPCALMESSDLGLNVNLVNQHQLFYPLITRKDRPLFNYDLRETNTERIFRSAQQSDKGRYLSGIIDIFGGLHFSYHLFQQRYWRNVLALLSNQNPLKDDGKRKRVTEALKKKIKPGQSFFAESNEKNIEWLTEFILKLAGEQSNAGKEQPFKFFLRHALKELEEYNEILESESERIKPSGPETCAELKKELAFLTERSILHMGFRTHCNQCGYANWHGITEANLLVNCSGCGSQYPIQPEQRWYYKLNNLVSTSIASQGLIPVIIVLGQLMMESRNSFFFSPCLEVYKEDNPYTDLDIVCIQDGRLIIGEVKQSINQFNKDFEIMLEVAKKIRPDVLLFSSMDQEITQKVKDNIKLLNQELKNQGTIVKWYQIREDVFLPNPVW